MLRLLTDRRVLLSALVVGGLVAVALWPSTVDVDVAAVVRGPLVVTIDEEGRTRVRDRFVVTAPVTGHVLRIELDPGDRVRKGDVVARLRSESPALLDARTRAEAEAVVATAEAALGRARVDEHRARLALSQSERELERMRELMRAGATAQQDLDSREDDVSLANETVEAAAFAVRAATAELERANARVGTRGSGRSGATVHVRAPVDGVILQRLRQSESVVPAGEPLVAIGDPRQTEVVTDLLSTDAVRVKPGARATIEQWGEDTPLHSIVRRVEPGGFTKMSALGVEEQRVNVVLDFAGEDDEYARLGDGYRVETRIVLWEAADVLRVPTAALLRHQSRWAVYVVREGRARLVFVDIGHEAGRDAEILSGLIEGTMVIVHPGDLVRDGVRVKTE